MDRVKVIRGIVKMYFVAAIAGSFTHIIEAAFKIGLTGWEAWSTPFMIDGLAIVGMTMRSNTFSRVTRKLGLRVQGTMGVLSLTANVYAARNIGGVIYGVAIVTLFLAAEWLAGHLEGAEVDQARELQEKRSQAAQKAAATRKRNATKRKRETKVLEDMLAH